MHGERSQFAGDPAMVNAAGSLVKERRRDAAGAACWPGWRSVALLRATTVPIPFARIAL